MIQDSFFKLRFKIKAIFKYMGSIHFYFILQSFVLFQTNLKCFSYFKFSPYSVQIKMGVGIQNEHLLFNVVDSYFGSQH